MNLREKLTLIQTSLKAPKGQFNSFGKYHYRSCEDILEALKIHLEGTKTAIIINDEIIAVGTRIYVKATATLLDNESDETISISASARESEDKKGMDASQITGATSSYARKYALNGLFCIDDNKDADSSDNSKDDKKPKQEQKEQKEYKCEKCGKNFEEWTDTKGKTWSAGQVANFSKNKNNGVALCYECSKAK
jgi:hypothetical protein